MSLSRELIVAAKARADAATEGPWDAEVGEDIQVNALSARTQWNGNVGTPARSWRTTDRILSVDDAEYELDEAEYEQRANDAEFIAAAREDVPVMADALLRVLDREKLARAIRDRVRLGPIGPNSAAIIAAGGRVSLTASEADDAADAVLDVLYGVVGSSPDSERSEQ